MRSLSDFASRNSRTEGRFTIDDEKRHNLFMRVGDPVVVQAVAGKGNGQMGPVEVMGRLREMKNAA